MTTLAVVTSRDTILDRIAEAFRQRDPYYEVRWPPLDSRRRKLNKALADLLKQGHPMECALQHLYEAKWLINYTDDWTSAAAALDACEKSVQEINQPRIVQGDDGSWGPCCREWYRKLEPTIDALQERSAATEPLKPLTFMNILQKPQNVTQLSPKSSPGGRRRPTPAGEPDQARCRSIRGASTAACVLAMSWSPPGTT